MKWLNRLSHRFWLWVGERIVIHRVEESIKETKERLIKEADSLFAKEFDGLSAIMDDNTVVATYDTMTRAPFPDIENEPIRKGYDKH